MSLELESLDVSLLGNLEFGQYIKDQTNPIDELPAGTITDPGLLLGIKVVKDKSDTYDKSMVKVAKNQLTDDVEVADKKRDDSSSAIGAAIALGLKSDTAAEIDAAENLQTLYNSYGGSKIASMNLEKETNAIDNFIIDLEGMTYAKDVATLGIGKFVDRLKKDNATFKTIFSQRLKGEVGKPDYNAVILRKDLNTSYSDFSGYVLYNAKLQGTGQFTKVLDILNVTRKYYSNLIATRKGRKKANNNKNNSKKEGDNQDETKLPTQEKP